MKNLLQKRKASGFTIIEVMIVLAIAGLIMVVVFIAVPQLQRNQRDNARQSIANRVKAELDTYASNNQGLYPFKTTGTSTGTISDFVTRYIDTAGSSATCNDSGQKVDTCDPTLAVPVMTGAGATTGAPQPFGSSFTTISGTVTHGQLYIVYGAKCNGENMAASGNNTVTTRTYAVMIGLDRDHTAYCVDNG